jgi:hypothetical protein
VSDARTLMIKYGFMASVEQWARVLRDAECAALIPVVCQVYYDYQVSIRVSGMSVGGLYEELRCAIVQQKILISVQPLDWAFSTIVSGYNAHPVFNEMYDFQVAVSQGTLNHGRRVLLSILYSLASRMQLDLGHWQAAYESVLFPEGVILLDCAGYNKTYLLTQHPHAVFGTCVGPEIVELLRQSFSEEDQKALVPVDQLPPRVRLGARARCLGVLSLDSALAQMIQDEKTTMGQRASSARALTTTQVKGSEDVVKYPHLGHSQRLTGEVPVDETATVTAFMWLFTLKSVMNNMHLSIADPTVEMVFVPRQVGGPSGAGTVAGDTPGGHCVVHVGRFPGGRFVGCRPRCDSTQ